MNFFICIVLFSTLYIQSHAFNVTMNQSTSDAAATGFSELNGTSLEVANNNTAVYTQYFLVELYTFPFIIIIGTLSNSLTFMVMRRKRMRRQSTYFYMGVLAIADELVLLLGCLNFWLYIYTGKSFIFLSVLSCKITCMALYATLHFSVWIVVIMTVERFIAVALPLQANRLCTVRRAQISTSILAAIVLCINLHFVFTHSLTEGECKSTSPLYSSFMNIVWPWIDGIIYSFIPLSLLILFNILILHNLFKASKNAEKIRRSSKNSNSTNNTTGLYISNYTETNNNNNKNKAHQILQSLFCCNRRIRSPKPAVSKETPQAEVNNLTVLRTEDTSPCRLIAKSGSIYSGSSSNLANNNRYKVSGHTQQASNFNRKLTIMLITVSITFCITSMPIVMLQSIEQAGLIDPNRNMSVLRGIFLVLQYLNHSINFFLYAITGKAFRNEFMALYMSWKMFFTRDESNLQTMNLTNSKSRYTYMSVKYTSYKAPTGNRIDEKTKMSQI